jgi:hypothetical protein
VKVEDLCKAKYHQTFFKLNAIMKLFLDSGAFSAWNSNKTIDFQSYIEFAKKYQNDLDLIANLDVIPGAPNRKLFRKDIEEACERGMVNYKRMLKSGISFDKLIHTFHQGDDQKWLEKIIKECGPYIGISPANDKTTDQRKEWLTNTCMPQLIKDGKPIRKFHGFAVTALQLVWDYPWYSVDSSSWRLRGGGYGRLDLPVAPHLLKKKEHYYIVSPLIGTGAQGYAKFNENSNSLFDVPRITQAEVSFFGRHEYKKGVDKLLAQYGYTFEQMQNSAMDRSIWNGIYLLETNKKFSNTVIFLGTSQTKPIVELYNKMKKENLDTNEINVLVSFAAIGNKNNTSKVLDELINLKREYNDT